MFEEHFIELNGANLYRCHWAVESPRAAVLIAHGMGEHIGRYHDFAVFLNGLGFTVYGSDHRGHGKSCAAESFGDMGVGGWEACLDDMADYSSVIRAGQPGLPLLLIGHSMGAMLSQQFIARSADCLSGVILSGSPGFAPPALMSVATWISKFEAWRRGAKQDSNVLKALVFDGNNKAFGGSGTTSSSTTSSSTTGYEWLSRDKGQVRAYMEDPACGFVLRNGSMVEFFSGAKASGKASTISSIPQQLPILVLSGEADPVHSGLANLNRLINVYRNRGLKVDEQIYPGGRHEMLNETNKEQVRQDIAAWLEARL